MSASLLLPNNGSQSTRMFWATPRKLVLANKSYGWCLSSAALQCSNHRTYLNTGNGLPPLPTQSEKFCRYLCVVTITEYYKTLAAIHAKRLNWTASFVTAVKQGCCLNHFREW